MQYFKHSQLANQYHVSLKTVHNWIDAAKNDKVKLALHAAKSGTYVANTAENVQTLESLAEKGKKYRNTLHQKFIQPKQEFYDIYSRRQILDIINNIDIHREIPRQYNYLEGGAANWDNWLKRLSEEDTPNILNATIELFKDNFASIDQLIEEKTRVNIIDLGVGNAFPVRGLIKHLHEAKKLHRYIGLDISPAMIDVARKNIEQWFNGEVNFEGHVRDITYERFDDLLVDDMLDSDSTKTINIVLLLGGTPVNFRSYNDVFKAIYGSMSANDLMIYADKLDTETSRRYFDFNTVVSGSSIKPGMRALSPNYKYILDLMNIDESLYDVEAGFDPIKYQRYVRIRFTTAVTLEFDIDGAQQTIRLEKGQTILMLRVWHLSALQYITEFEHTGFIVLHSTLTKNRQFFLSISGIEHKPAKEI